MIKCEHCGNELVDGGHIGWYCSDKDCNITEMRRVYKQLKEQVERKELARLKAKYETVHRST
jgi:hypothetical protein